MSSKKKVNGKRKINKLKCKRMQQNNNKKKNAIIVCMVLSEQVSGKLLSSIIATQLSSIRVAQYIGLATQC
jgi:ornithine cyclodeaminase/alanine dehydrogenase-like protein (mu-crystallin family)